jgi:hypothetical protein
VSLERGDDLGPHIPKTRSTRFRLRCPAPDLFRSSALVITTVGQEGSPAARGTGQEQNANRIESERRLRPGHKRTGPRTWPRRRLSLPSGAFCLLPRCLARAIPRFRAQNLSWATTGGPRRPEAPGRRPRRPDGPWRGASHRPRRRTASGRPRRSGSSRPSGRQAGLHDVELPQLHRAGPLPPHVVRAFAPPGPRLDEPGSHQDPVDARARRDRVGAFAGEFVGEVPRSPPRMVAAELDHLELGSGGRPVRQLLGHLDRSTRPAMPRSW